MAVYPSLGSDESERGQRSLRLTRSSFHGARPWLPPSLPANPSPPSLRVYVRSLAVVASIFRGAGADFITPDGSAVVTPVSRSLRGKWVEKDAPLRDAGSRTMRTAFVGGTISAGSVMATRWAAELPEAKHAATSKRWSSTTRVTTASSGLIREAQEAMPTSGGTGGCKGSSGSFASACTDRRRPPSTTPLTHVRTVSPAA
jgi:hypothetical protein